MLYSSSQGTSHNLHMQCFDILFLSPEICWLCCSWSNIKSCYITLNPSNSCTTLSPLSFDRKFGF